MSDQRPSVLTLLHRSDPEKLDAANQIRLMRSRWDAWQKSVRRDDTMRRQQERALEKSACAEKGDA
jgi:hypothetical protein